MRNMPLLLTALLALLCLPRFSANAQCYDCMEREKGEDWRFVAGVTLYTNNSYVLKEKFLERQPLELNLRYKFGQHHVLRLQVPFSFKVNMHGEAVYESPLLNDIMDGNGDKASALWQAMKANSFGFVRTNQLYYSLLGVSVGYDYDFKLKYNLSVFGGVDLAYTHLKFHTDYFGIGFSELDEEEATQLQVLYYITNEHRNNCFSVKPLIGCRYLFQKKLLVECSVGYGLTFGKRKGEMVMKSYRSSGTHVTPFERENDFNQVVAQVAVGYSF